MAKIVIVDDHSVVRMATRLLLEQAGHCVVGEAGTGIEAVSVVRNTTPDLVLLDIDLPEIDGITVLKKILACPPIKVLIFSAMPHERFSTHCSDLGASGYVHKGASPEELIHSINIVLSGYSIFPKRDAKTELDCESRIASLSARELMIFKKIAHGLRNKDIADSLMLSEKTISTYKVRLKKKLGVSNIVDMLELAKQYDL